MMTSLQIMALQIANVPKRMVSHKMKAVFLE